MFPLLETITIMSSGKVDKVSNICNIVPMGNEYADHLDMAARLFKVLGHPVRLAMLEYLRERPWCVCEIAAKLGLNKSTASKHLSLLKSVGVVGMEKQGTQVICTLATPCVVDMMRCAVGCRIPREDGNRDADSCPEASCGPSGNAGSPPQSSS